jgi:hypothetical protein
MWQWKEKKQIAWGFIYKCNNDNPNVKWMHYQYSIKIEIKCHGGEKNYGRDMKITNYYRSSKTSRNKRIMCK